MKVIPIKLSDELVEKIDYLVKSGKYSNRSIAIRQLLENTLKDEEIFYNNAEYKKNHINKIINSLIKEKKVILDIAPGKTAVEIIAEGRER
ncbi:MAG: ribbon-helix-helix domain-containing protein [Candidatus Helarchaeota archaeon]